MIVVCDMGPLHYLVLIGAEHVLPQLLMLAEAKAPKTINRRIASLSSFYNHPLDDAVRRLSG